jgi:hypothetical protein
MRFRRPYTPRPPRPTLTPGLRHLWRIGGTLWVLLLVPFGIVQAASVLAHERELAITSFPAAALASVDIDNDNGSVTIVGTDNDEVVVAAHISHGWKATGNDQHVEGDRLVVHSSCPSLFSQYCSVDYVVEMPAALALDVSSGNGRITASDLTGVVSLAADNGRVEADRLDGDLRLSSDNGRVTGRDLRSPGVDADSDNGRVELSFAVAPRSVTATSDNGSVDLVVPDDSTAYRVDAASDNGSVTVGVDQSRDSSRTITALSDNGSIRVDYAR